MLSTMNSKMLSKSCFSFAVPVDYEWTGFRTKGLELFDSQLAFFAQANGEKLDGMRTESATGAEQLREEDKIRRPAR